jgi:hypothetical protein
MTIISNRVFSLLTNFLFQVSAVITPRPFGLTLCVNANIIAEAVIFACTSACQVSIPFFINLIFYLSFSGTNWARVARLFEHPVRFLRYVWKWVKEMTPFFTWSLSFTGSLTFPYFVSPTLSLYCGWKGLLVEVLSIPVLAPLGLTFPPYNTVQLCTVIIPMSQSSSNVSLPISPAGMRRFYRLIMSIKRWWQRDIRPVIYFIDLA